MRLNQEGRVSIIVNMYNNEKYLEECLTSLIQQTYDNIEIVIVDGNSTDKSLQIANDMLINSRRPYLVYHTNGPERYTPMGLMWGFLVGAGNSTGEFLTFHAADDASTLNRIQYLVNALKNSNCVLSYSKTMFINNELKSVGQIAGDKNQDIYNAVMSADPTPIHITGVSTLFYKWAYFTERSYQLGSNFWECAHTLKMYAVGDFVFVPDASYLFRVSTEQEAAKNESHSRTELQGYDYNELHLGKYNYAIDSVMKRKIQEEGLVDCDDSEQWSKWIGMNVVEWKRMARRRLVNG